MTNDARVVFETIAKLAGLSVIFDPDFTSRRIPVELPNVTLEQALDAVALESKAFWKPLTPSVIFVAPDNPQKRKDVEDEVVRTFYLSNTLTPQDLTEVVTGLRAASRSAPGAAGERAERHRDPRYAGQAGAGLENHPRHRQGQARGFDPRAGADGERGPLARSGNSAGAERLDCFHSAHCAATKQRHADRFGHHDEHLYVEWSTATQITLDNLKNLSGADYSVTLPGATANAILTDNKTQIIQDPEVRVSDGEKATLKIGERVPVATGSFQAGVGVGVGTARASSIRWSTRSFNTSTSA